MLLHKINLKVFALFITNLFLYPAFAEFIPMDRELLIQDSEIIILGTVVDKKSFWNTQKNLILTRVTFEVEETLWGSPSPVLTLRFAGGTIGAEKHVVSDVPEFEIGERVLLMVDESNSQNGLTPITPITGGLQGVFKEKLLQDDVTDQKTNFTTFVQNLREIISQIKAAPLHMNPSLDQEPFSDEFFTKSNENESMEPQVLDKIFIPRPEKDPLDNSENKNIPEEPLLEETQIKVSRDMEECKVPFAKPYIIFTPWDPPGPPQADKESMAYWNQYIDIFRLWAHGLPKKWQNGCNDIWGRLTTEELQNHFGGISWGIGQISARFGITDPNRPYEVDIVLNHSVKWTSNRSNAYYKQNTYYLHDAFARELASVIGIRSPSPPSIKNFLAETLPMRAYGRIHVNDRLEAIKRRPQAILGRVQDVGISFHDTLYTRFDLPNVIEQDKQLSTKFLLENISADKNFYVFIEWKLVHNMFGEYGYSLETKRFGLPRVGSAVIEDITLTIPTFVANGKYYLLGKIVGFPSGSTIEKDVIWQNNRYWSYKPITIIKKPE